MALIKKKGKAGAAKAYINRTSAIRKLQCSLSDFRRLCILKGIYPREPRNRKKANKGSSAPTLLYYAKDIAYLAHEPILKKFREHKTFAKKLDRALGRGEWSVAKSLETTRPVYRLDHVIKERYPTFIDAVRDIDDALCLVFLFASLPSLPRLHTNVVHNCSRLAAEWQLYVMHTKSLQKVFLSIKGIYYQAVVSDETITWLVPYQFTQHVPADVDIRVMTTFLELYQTLLGFVFFKLYTDAGLAYPPPIDLKKDEEAAGVGALILKEVGQNVEIPDTRSTNDVKSVSAKVVRRSIKEISAQSPNATDDAGNENILDGQEDTTMAEDDFVVQASMANPNEGNALPTFQSLSTLPRSIKTDLFSQYTFFISRETSRALVEFVIRSFGGRVGWPKSLGSGSPFEETDMSITHVITDRPILDRTAETDEERRRRLSRKYIQPQWVVDCINAGKILLEEPYEQGKTLPPHLSPFGEGKEAYDPTKADDVASEGEEVDEDEEVDMHDGEHNMANIQKAIKETVGDEAALRVAELEAEAAGVDSGVFEKELKKAARRTKDKTSAHQEDSEKDMNKMMMSHKKKKLYDRIKFGENKRTVERTKLEQRKVALRKAKNIPQ